MGLLRLFLAISVALQHSGKAWGIGGGRAVEIFFIISGFYMGLILSSGKYQNYKTYLINRFLRIFPLYWVILLLTIGIYFSIKIFGLSNNFFLLSSYVQHVETLKMTSWLFLILSNLFIFTQEGAHFMGLHDGGFYLTHDFATTPPPLALNFLVIPQAWSLALELTFYFLAPFLLWRKTKNALYLLLTFILLSLFCKVLLLTLGYSYDPWGYRFFPSVFYLFLLGTITYQYYSNYPFQQFKTKTLILIAFVLGFLMGTYYCWLAPYKVAFIKSLVVKLTPFEAHLLKISEILLQSTLPYLAVCMLICVLFHLTAKNRWDKWLGELSYPLYICHILIINILTIFLLNDSYFSYISLTVSLLFSIILNKVIQKPIDRYRTSRLTQALQPPNQKTIKKSKLAYIASVGF